MGSTAGLPTKPSQLATPTPEAKITETAAARNSGWVLGADIVHLQNDK
jgi:hypothetical protein